MDIIKDLDLSWYWLGYSCGVNSRKKLKENPNRIENFGKQGIKTTPTEKQKISFFIGLMTGRRKIVNNLNIVIKKQHQDKNPHKSKGDYLTLEIAEKEAVRGETVVLPIYICNNSVDNRGFCGFQLKIKYNPAYLSFNDIIPTSLWPHSFKYQHDAAGGIVLVQGLREDIGYEDVVFANISFTVKKDSPSKVPVYLSGPNGTGAGTDILTRINGELFYIMPVSATNGVILLDDLPEEEKDILPPIGDTDDTYGKDVDFTYDFTLDLDHVGGSGSGGGASFVVGITLGDGTRVEVEIPLQEGEHHYKGKIPIKLPSLGKGPIVIDYYVKPDDPEDIYYWFIKAGALWGFESEIPRDTVGEMPILEPKKLMIEFFRFLDFVSITKDTPGPSPSPEYQSIEEIFRFVDFEDIRKFIEKIEEDTEGFSFSDNVFIRKD